MNTPPHDSGAAGLHPVGPARNADAAAKPHPHDHGSGDLRPHQLVERLRAALTPIQLAVALSMLRPADEYTAAATAGLQVAWLRWARGGAMAEASRAVSAALPAGWADDHLPHDELLRRRYPPDGDRFAWARGGGAA